jgi:cell division protein FtsL
MTTAQQNKKKLGVKQVLLGSVLLNAEVVRWLPTVGLLAFLGLLMISNRFKGEKILRETVVVEEQLKELRSEAANTEAELMNMSRYSEIVRRVNDNGLGLKQPNVPPIQIKTRK